MTDPSPFVQMVHDYADQVQPRIEQLATMAAGGGLDDAIMLLADAVQGGGVLQAFGTGHSEAFAMEIAGRAGGLIPTNKIALRDLVLRGAHALDTLGGSSLERDACIVDELWGISPIHPGDVFLIASNSGVNGSIVGLAIRAKAEGHPVIAVTSLQHTMQVQPKHPSGRRLSEIADVVLDNRAPYGDTTIELPGGIGVGAVSSLTAAYIAQLITIAAAARIAALGETPPIYLSANIPGGDDHNHALEARYGDRIRRTA